MGAGAGDPRGRPPAPGAEASLERGDEPLGIDVAAHDEEGAAGTITGLVEGLDRVARDLRHGVRGAPDRTAVQPVAVEFGDRGEVGDGRRIVAVAFDLVQALAPHAVDFAVREVGFEHRVGEEVERLLEHVGEEVHRDGADGIAGRGAVAGPEAVEPTGGVHRVPAGRARREEPRREFRQSGPGGRFGARAGLEDEPQRHLGDAAPSGVLDPEAVGERAADEAGEHEGARRARGRAARPIRRHASAASGTTWTTVRRRGSSTSRATRSTSGRPIDPYRANASLT